MGSEKCFSLIFGLRAILLEKTETLPICGLALWESRVESSIHLCVSTALSMICS